MDQDADDLQNSLFIDIEFSDVEIAQLVRDLSSLITKEGSRKIHWQKEGF